MKKALFLLCLSAFAQAEQVTILELGGGLKTYTSSNGQSATSMDLGNMTIINHSSGNQTTIMDLGGGLKSIQDTQGHYGTIHDLGGGLEVINGDVPDLFLID